MNNVQRVAGGNMSKANKALLTNFANANDTQKKSAALCRVDQISYMK